MIKVTTFKSYVYLIGYGDKVKIGKSNNPQKRLIELQTAIHEELRVIGTLGCNTEDEAYELEKELHNTYAERNIRGEWFTLNSSEVEWLLDNNGIRMVSIPTTDIIDGMKDLTPKAYQLLIYYYSKVDGWKFNDKEIADTLDTTERMVKKYRKELIDLGYLWIMKGDLTVYFVGRKAVYEFKYTSVDEQFDDVTGELL